jgi:hypothetical protein
MGHRHEHRLPTDIIKPLLGYSVKHKIRLAVRVVYYPYICQFEVPHTRPEGFAVRLFGGEPCGEGLHHPRAARVRIFELIGMKIALEQPGL